MMQNHPNKINLLWTTQWLSKQVSNSHQYSHMQSAIQLSLHLLEQSGTQGHIASSSMLMLELLYSRGGKEISSIWNSYYFHRLSRECRQHVANMLPTCRPDTAMSANFSRKGMSWRHTIRKKRPRHTVIVSFCQHGPTS
jgi:hypothetical protein